MNFLSLRIITADVARLVDFYEWVTRLSARWATPQFAEIVTSACTLAIGGTETMRLFADAAVVPAANRSAILEFLVDDVDQEFARLVAEGLTGVVQEPTTMPWGNRSALFRDPDQNLINLFRPVTADAAARFDLTRR